MSIWGKILGAAAGLALGGPLGALVGGAAGHAVDRYRDEANGGGDATRSIAFTIGVIALGAKMAKADGTVTPAEIDAFNQAFQVPPDEARNVSRVFDRARRDSAGYEPYARQLAGMFRDRPEVLEELMDCLFHIAKADGGVTADEQAYLRSVAGLFGLSDADFGRLCAEQGTDCNDPYAVLGLDPFADEAAVRSAYRRLAREHHPDRLIADGMPAEFLEVATEKMAAINTAYDRIKRERALA